MALARISRKASLSHVYEPFCRASSVPTSRNSLARTVIYIARVLGVLECFSSWERSEGFVVA